MVLLKILFLPLSFFFEIIFCSSTFLTEISQISIPQLNKVESSLKTNKKDASFYHSIPKVSMQDQKKAAVSFYNQGVIALNKGEENTAQLAFEKSFYNYLYFPAYKALKSMGHSATLLPFVWHIIMGIYGLVSLVWIFLLFLRKVSFRVKVKTFIIWSLSMMFFIGFHVLAFQPKGRSLRTFELKNAPLTNAFAVELLEKGESFWVLKSKGEWVKIKTGQNQKKGWALKENLYFTRD